MAAPTEPDSKTSTPDKAPSARLEAAFAAWSRQPWPLHVAAVLALAALLTLRWWSAVWNPHPQGDETIYFKAFDAVLAGKSPASVRGYLYFPFLAITGARQVAAYGAGFVMAQLRLANLFGLAVTAWCALAWSPWGNRRKILVAAAVLSLAPAAHFGMTYGNLSLAVSGLVIGGLLLWPRAPASAGFLLGLSIGLKPLAPVAVLALGAHRPREGGRLHQAAAIIAILVSSGLVFGFPYLGDILSRAQPHLASRSVSLHRFPYIFGVEMHPIFILAGLAAVTVLLVRQRPLPRRLFLCLALTATLAATPLVWSHTLLMTLPIQVLALQTAWWRSTDRSTNGGHQGPLQRLEVFFILLAVAAIQFSAGATGIDDQAVWLQLAGTLPPALAPGILTGYLFWTASPPVNLDAGPAQALAPALGAKVAGEETSLC